MKVILSTTDDPLYSFFAPIAIYSWLKIDCEALLFSKDDFINIPDNKKPTYSQCIRLFATALKDIHDDEMIITSDIDMVVFNKTFFDQADPKKINIFGHDLTNEGQFPMCYCAMTAKNWRKVMNIGEKNIYECLDELLGKIEVENMRGNYWCKDQETLHDRCIASGIEINKIDRRKSDEHRIATNRIDRDGWNYSNRELELVIDAHLPRPGYTSENFDKILTLLSRKYPADDFTWLTEHRKNYVTLLKG
jgi:hypothetical protein